jgi:hypothetical protein
MKPGLKAVEKQDRISESDLATFNYAINELDQAKAILLKAQGAVETIQRYWAKKYQLNRGDGINVEDGAITREPAEQPPSKSD